LSLVVSASWVVPGDRPPIRDGAVAVSNDRITWVGRADDSDAPTGDRRELGNSVLLPGLVNAHCHLELSHLRGRLDRTRGFVPWVEDLVGRRSDAQREDVRTAAADAIRALEDSGTAAVGDVSNALDHLDLLAVSALSAVVFYELLGWDPARSAQVLDAADERLQVLEAAGTPRVVLAAHAPHSVSPELLAALVKRGGPAAIHLAESPAETKFLASGDGEWRAFLDRRGLGGVTFQGGDASPVAYVDRLGVLHPRLVAAHCVQVDAADAKLLAARGVHVALCPRSNRNLDVGIAPVERLEAAGVPLCVGTDSLASVETLELIDDMALLRREHPGVAAEKIVAMATSGGAGALGIPELGALAPGFRARLAFAPADRNLSDPFAYLVSGEARPRSVQW
jgi:aminodeoxyfutalosine deaminase